MALKSLFNDFHNPVDLSDSDYRNILEPLQIPIPLRHTARHNNWLLLPLSSRHHVNKLLLGGVLNGTRVKEAHVGFIY
jgi:hypothetical protein